MRASKTSGSARSQKNGRFRPVRDFGGLDPESRESDIFHLGGPTADYGFISAVAATVAPCILATNQLLLRIPRCMTAPCLIFLGSESDLRTNGVYKPTANHGFFSNQLLLWNPGRFTISGLGFGGSKSDLRDSNISVPARPHENGHVRATRGFGGSKPELRGSGIVHRRADR